MVCRDGEKGDRSAHTRPHSTTSHKQTASTPLPPAPPPPAAFNVPAAATPGGVPLPDGDELLGMTAHTPGFGGGTGTPAALVGGGGGGTAAAAAATPPPAYGGGGATASTAYSAGAGRPAWGGYGPGGGAAAGPRPFAPAAPAPRSGPAHPPSSTSAGGGLPSALARARSAATSTAAALRAELAAHAHLALAQASDADGSLGMPPAVGPYHSLFPLEDGASGSAPPGRPSACLGGLHTAVLKGLAASDGGAVALRRLDPGRAPPTADLVAAARTAVAAWAPLAGHPNLSVPTSVLVSSDWAGPGGGPGPGHPALWFVHELHAGAASLASAHLLPIATPSGALVRRGATPDQLWSYLVQLACALRAAHTAGRALRVASLHASKVLLVPPGRLRVGSLGLADALAPLAPAPGAPTIAGAPPPPPSPDALAAAQRADLAAVGRLVLELAASAAGAPASLDPRTLARLPPDLAALTAALCAADAPAPPAGAPAPPRVTSWHQLAASLGGRLLAELDAGALLCDAVGAQLALEAGHGRLLRVLSRLSAVTERPEGEDVDAGWAEAGDAYVLKLFRDFVFHQPPALPGDPAAGLGGGPASLDWSHVAECLAKLDAGVPERLLLLSRDGGTMLVVTYGDVKRCMEGAWRDLEARAAAARRRARGEQ
jgi:PAB-dependent poly(A)-specific ribonuclease subunit 3